MNDIQAPMSAAELREARSALVETVERFARSEIAPNVSAWDAAGEFPRSLYRRAGFTQAWRYFYWSR